MFFITKRLAVGAITLVALFVTVWVMAADGKVEVSSDNVLYSPDGDTAVFSGNVNVETEGWHLQADTLTVSIADNERRRYRAVGRPLLINGVIKERNVNIAANMVFFKENNNDLLFRHNVRLCLDDSCQDGELLADEVQWLHDENRVIASGRPIIFTYLGIEDKAPVHLSANHIEYDIDGGEIKMSGAVEIKHTAGEIKGETILYNIKTGAIKAESAEGGRVRATFSNE